MSGDPVPKPIDATAARALSVEVSDRQSLPVDAAGLAALAERTLLAEGRTSGELALSFVDEQEMAELHVRYLDDPGATDVLSFAMDEDGLLGDVVVCPAFAAREHPDLAAECRLLVVHGVLHVLGYDHEEDADRAEMWARQERYSGVRAP
jgi:probable rRNA maturation factor